MEHGIAPFCHELVGLCLLIVFFNSIPLRSLSVTCISSEILNNIIKITKNFLWSNEPNSKGLHILAWNTVIFPKGVLVLSIYMWWTMLCMLNALVNMLLIPTAFGLRWFKPHMISLILGVSGIILKCVEASIYPYWHLKIYFYYYFKLLSYILTC